jgi:O-antigen/teichoic acid export membrane protein
VSRLLAIGMSLSFVGIVLMIASVFWSLIILRYVNLSNLDQTTWDLVWAMYLFSVGIIFTFGGLVMGLWSLRKNFVTPPPPTW